MRSAVGDNAVNQLQKSVNSNLEATIAVNVSIENKEAAEKIHQLYTIIRVINGVATLLSGPRYVLLRIKCIRWFNLSRASGIFILIASLVLDILEYKSINDSEKQVKQLGAVSTIKLPKNWLKSQNFQEQCIFSVIEHLAVHFAQWSFHMSFPELAIIPIMRLNKFGERTTLEGLKLVVKRFIKQGELNIECICYGGGADGDKYLVTRDMQNV
ncbi:hypothetical protein HID58_083722 [Brassica napus]|uniref:Uncharacterized protein n=1 Tax=Brassica napus TaxID=3708 RepID=A0ABQ7YE27_BRANA|nr:hypothetical protein HID58_083722 [Brassica napus]